ncbi:ABC transporter substrate-binding protein [Arthrobacter bambusae]|uniref:ABC transporter substrate-binding protein n=1 Tax=Arthrobacter bambusae TaxID=1338426 RepID=UPI001F511F72|nr:ABC transporter substrate-binding protein [Arthrobacter bambusae]MCI0140681.1 ABC transporter substrate-binding protein [Arthrobacter bambusae]
MRSITPLVALVGAAALALTACAAPGASGNHSGNELATDGTFTMAIGADPGNLNPMITAMNVARTIDRFLYSRLVEVGSDGTILSGLANKWKADTTNATFTLRKDATCADGTPITASMLADNINFIADPKNGSPLVGLNVQAGTVATGDDATGVLSVKSGAPDAFLLENVGSVHMVCGPALAHADALAKGEGATGMYTMTKIAPNSQYTLTRRKEFVWGPGDWDPKQAGIPATVIFKVLPNETTAANLLLSGELNAAQVVGPDSDRLRTNKLFSNDVQVGLGQIQFNKNPKKLLSDKALRLALTQDLNLEKLRAVLSNGKGTAPTSLVNAAPNPCHADVAKANIPAFDVKAAADALDSAGWKPGSDGVREKNGVKLSLTVIYPSYISDSFGSTAELLQSMWKELGVEATPKGVDANGVSQTLFGTGDWDVALISVGVGLPSQIVPFFAGSTPPKGSNFGYTDNAEYIAATTSAATKPGKEGCDDWSHAEAALIAAADVIPFANSVVSVFGSKAEFVQSDSIEPASIRLFK